MNRIGKRIGLVLILCILAIPVNYPLRVSVSPWYFGAVSQLPAAFAAPSEPIRELWRRPMDDAQGLAVSADGSRCAFVTWGGDVVCWVGNRLAWRRAVPGAEAVILGRDGQAVVYTRLDARRRDLLVLDAGGQVVRRITVGAPITAVALSPDGGTAAAGTVSGALEIHPLDARSAPHRTALPGTIQQLYYDASGGLVATTAEPAWIAALGPDGVTRWRHPAPAGQEFRIGVPPRAEGSGAITVAAAVPIGGLDHHRLAVPESGAAAAAADLDPNRIELIAFSAAGKPVWRRVLHGRDPHLGVMPASGAVVVAYERAERRRLVLRYERAILFLTGEGVPRRELGGMVYNPLLVCASPRGNTILSLGAGNRFWLLSGTGQLLWSYTAAAPIRMARASADGTTVAVATSDHKLSLLKISPGST
jgi:hypothetical protein